MANHKTKLKTKNDTKVCQYLSSVERFKTGGCIICVSNECCEIITSRGPCLCPCSHSPGSSWPSLLPGSLLAHAQLAAHQPPGPSPQSCPQPGRISLCWCQGLSLSRSRTLHLSFLNFMRLDHTSSLSRHL